MQPDPAHPNVMRAFTTPILQKLVPDTGALNEGLTRAILERCGNVQGVNRSNAGGWQSPPDLLRWPIPEAQRMNQLIQEGLLEIMEAEIGTRQFECKLSIACWANVNRNGDFNRIHTHGQSDWSGVYYVSMGDPDPERPSNGAIEFLDPRGWVSPTPGARTSMAATIHPMPGMMLMFPGWLSHGVLPFFGEGERITIAFNLRISDFKRGR